METPPLEVSVTELHVMLQQGEEVSLIDCREPAEHAIAALENARLMPMGSIPSCVEAVQALPAPLIVYCHHGMRSAQTAQWLRANGVEHAQSLAGGIDAWAENIDPSLPRY